MPVKVFICYAREDEDLLKKLKTHLRPLEREGLIELWHDRDISAGTDWEKEIDAHLKSANIILLLISPDFMASDYCWGVEMEKAMERHGREEAKVIPIILRPVIWQRAQLGKLQALPADAKPITSWPNVDEAFFDVAREINEMAEKIEEAEALVSLELARQKAMGSRVSLSNSEIASCFRHFIWILDCSSSMKGDDILSLTIAIADIMPELKKVSQAYKDSPAKLLFRVITFSSGAKWHLSQPTPIDQFKLTDLEARGKRDAGRALQMVAEELKIMDPSPLHNAPPVLVLALSGYPTDNIEQGIQAILDQFLGRHATRIGVGVGSAVPYDLLEKFIANPERPPLQLNNLEGLIAYIDWNHDDYYYYKYRVSSGSLASDALPDAMITSSNNLPDSDTLSGSEPRTEDVW